MKKLLVFVVLLAVGAGAAYHFGYLERLGLGRLRVRLIPKDPALFAYFPAETRELLIVQATAEHHIPLSKEDQELLGRQVEELQAKSGFNPLRDVDALAIGFRLGVIRGHFDWSRLSAFLQSKGCELTTVGGVPAALKRVETKNHAVKYRMVGLALDGNYLLVGTDEDMEGALSLKRQGKGLGNDSPLVKTLDEMGWNHAVVAGLLEDSPVMQLMASILQLRAQSLRLALDLPAEGLELQALADTGDPQKGDELRTRLDKWRELVLLKANLDATPEGRTLSEALKKATLESNTQGRMRGTLRIPYTLVEQTSTGVYRSKAEDELEDLNRFLGLEQSAASGQPSVPPSQPTAAPVASLATPVTLDWKPPVLGLVLLVVALVTMSAQTRPGLFNVLIHPLFLLPFLLATMGVFVLRWTGPAGGAFDVLALPMPEWHRFVSLPVAPLLTLSAAVPLVFALLSAPVPWLRRFAAGLAMGFSAWLAVKALASPPLPLIPPAFTLYWYVGNALAALVMARLALPPRRAMEPRPQARRHSTGMPPPA